MKQAILIHNPSAGDEDHRKKDMVMAIEKEGFGCVYFSVKKDDSWKEQLDQADFGVVAGGDGTVRKVVQELVKRNVLDKKLPLAILPMGTANNLSKTLGISRELDDHSHIKRWKRSKLQRFDIGIVKNTDSADFFLESTGFGAFPNLMQKMDMADKKEVKTAKDKLKLARETLLDIVLYCHAASYRVKTEDMSYEGKSILLEVMNIASIGPNLILSEEAKTDDGLFNIVIVEESQREDYASYIRKLIKDEKAIFNYKTFTTKELSIEIDSRDMHIDDELTIPSKNPVVIELREHILDFLVPEDNNGDSEMDERDSDDHKKVSSPLFGYVPDRKIDEFGIE